jgi:TPP-dependent indolepyruvate ferredoxin oxidoreductase alpha subunit
MTTATNQRTASSEGTQAHNDAANKRANIKYWTHVEGMDRDEAKKKVDHPTYKMMTNAEINKAIKIEAKRQETLRKRAELDAKKKAEEEAELKRQEATQKQWENDAKKAEEKAKTESEPKKINQRSIGISVNGTEYPSICKAMAAYGIPDKGTKNWFKIRAALKKSNEIDFEYGGEVFKFIQL